MVASGPIVRAPVSAITRIKFIPEADATSLSPEILRVRSQYEMRRRRSHCLARCRSWFSLFGFGPDRPQKKAFIWRISACNTLNILQISLIYSLGKRKVEETTWQMVARVFTTCTSLRPYFPGLGMAILRHIGKAFLII